MLVDRSREASGVSDSADDSRPGGTEPRPPWGDEITPLTEVCGGRYVLLHELARGDLSVIYQAKLAGSREPIAFKVLQPRFVGKETQVRRFRREAEVLRRIEHPNVVRVIEHGEIEDGRDFIAMELLVGRTLAEVLAAKARMSAERVCRIARQISRALRTMHHAGIIHRDLQPENVLLIGPDDGERVKLVDFSAAGDVGAPARRVKAKSGRTRATGDVLEIPSYRAPEQLRKRPPQPSMDVYALGVIMYEMLAGEHPFAKQDENAPSRLGAHTIRTKVFDAPEVLLGLVVDCIERDPRERPPSMDAVLERIDKALLWIGVVPHELDTKGNDEDARTQLWAAADPDKVAPPSEPSSQAEHDSKANDAAARGSQPKGEDRQREESRKAHERRKAVTRAEPEVDPRDREPIPQRRRPRTNPPREPQRARDRGSGGSSTSGQIEVDPWPEPPPEPTPTSRRAKTIPPHDTSAEDSNPSRRVKTIPPHNRAGDSSSSRRARTNPPHDATAGDSRSSRRAKTNPPQDHRPGGPRASRKPSGTERDFSDPTSREPSAEIDPERLRESAAPTGPRFVVDTVAWTKQQPAAKVKPGTRTKVTRDRRHTTGSRKAVPRDRTGSGASASRSHTSGQRVVSAQDSASRRRTLPPEPEIPTWLGPLLIVTVIGLAIAVWHVWTS